jgi:hypothetical protein
MSMSTTTLSLLSDRELEAEVARLARAERTASAALIEHLAELYGRRLHERAGFASLFTYCTRVLLLSEHAAYDRIKAAKVARRYPAALSMLASGRVNLTTLRLLAPHLTRANHEQLLAGAVGKTKRQVQELVARMFPVPDVPASVRKVPGGRGEPGPPPREVTASPTLAVAAEAPRVATFPAAGIGATPGVSIPSPARPLVLPLAPDRYRITFTASEDTTRKLELARDLLRHAVPDGDPAEIVSRALDALLDDLLKQKFALTDRPRAGGRSGDASVNAAYIPAEVKRAVFIRDGGRCAFKGTHGRCGERAFLEFHHAVPRACGGQASVANIELRCRAHNGCEVDLWFGPGKRYRHREETVDQVPATLGAIGAPVASPGESAERGMAAWTP